MKKLLILVFLGNALITAAQRLEKRKIDKKTGDTTIQTTPTILANKTIPFTYSHYLTGAIVKIRPAQRQGVRYELQVHIVTIKRSYLCMGTDNHAIITFAGGQELRLPLTAFVPDLVSNTDPVAGTNSFRTGYNCNAVYLLTREDIATLCSHTITGVNFETSDGPLLYTVKAKRAAKMERNATLIANLDHPGSI